MGFFSILFLGRSFIFVLSLGNVAKLVQLGMDLLRLEVIQVAGVDRFLGVKGRISGALALCIPLDVDVAVSVL